MRTWLSLWTLVSLRAVRHRRQGVLLFDLSGASPNTSNHKPVTRVTHGFRIPDRVGIVIVVEIDPYAFGAGRCNSLCPKYAVRRSS
jgi:hypothetical protein